MPVMGTLGDEGEMTRVPSRANRSYITSSSQLRFNEIPTPYHQCIVRNL